MHIERVDTMRDGVVLLGGGGHCRSVIDVLELAQVSIAGIVDTKRPASGALLGYPYLGTDDDLPELAKRYSHALVTVGQIKTAAVRIALAEKLMDAGFVLPVVASPLAHVSPHARVEPGTVVMHYACVNAAARIGANCIINSRALVEHDAVVADHCHISTGAIVNGGASIGRGSFLGSGAVCREGITVPEASVIPMGATVNWNFFTGSHRNE